MTSDGEPVGQEQLQSIMKERYWISKNLHTSYLEIGKITPLERQKLMQFVVEDLEQKSQIMEQMKNTSQ